MRHFLFTVFLVVACTTVAGAGSYEDAVSAHERGDFILADRLFRSLAEQGNTRAQFSLGWMYANGEGVPQDDQEALKWYRRAAEQGDARAQGYLGLMYYEGQGVPQDNQEALKWWGKAAEQGDGEAQVNLGVMYDEGRGVPQDFVRAHMWFTVAATTLSDDDGNEAVTLRDGVASRMTAAQIEKAQEMARRCQETKFKQCD